MKRIFRIIELVIDPENDEHGVYAIALVSDPAIENDFVYFGKEYNTDFATIDEEQRLVVGPALIPNKMILRKHGSDYFYVYMNAETIKQTAQRFLTFGKQNNSTFEHKVSLKDVSVVESWIIEDKDNDKSNIYGYDLPVGTWMLSSKITNDAVWETIKSGEVKGYSIEGNYTDNMIEQSLEDNLKELEEMELYGTPQEVELYHKIIEILSEIPFSEDSSGEPLADTPESILEYFTGVTMNEDYELVSEREYSEENTPISEWVMEFADIIKQYSNKDSKLDRKPYKIRYVYAERHSSTNSRGFCKAMMKRTNSGVVYRHEDIMDASKLGINGGFAHSGGKYDLFKWKGGIYCGHYWKEQLYKLKDGVKDKALSSSDEISRTNKFKPKPKDHQIAPIAPIDTQNRGKHPNAK